MEQTCPTNICWIFKTLHGHLSMQTPALPFGVIFGSYIWAEKHALLRRKKRCTRKNSRRQFGSRFQLFNIILLSLRWGLPHACQLCNDIIVWSSYMSLTREFETNSWIRFAVRCNCEGLRLFSNLWHIYGDWGFETTETEVLKLWNFTNCITDNLLNYNIPKTYLQLSTTYLEVANVWIMGLSSCKFVYTYRAGFIYVCILTELVGLK